MAIKILREWLDLPADATDEQVEQKVKALSEDVKLYKGRSETYEKRLSEMTGNFERVAKKEKDLDAQRAKLFVEDAVRRMLVDKSEQEYWEKQYAADPEGTKKLFEGRSYRSLLARQDSISGEATPPDAITEAKVRVAEILTNDSTKKMTEADAYTRLWREDPKLWERHQEAKRAAAEPKGGER